MPRKTYGGAGVFLDRRAPHWLAEELLEGLAGVASLAIRFVVFSPASARGTLGHGAGGIEGGAEAERILSGGRGWSGVPPGTEVDWSRAAAHRYRAPGGGVIRRVRRYFVRGGVHVAINVVRLKLHAIESGSWHVGSVASPGCMLATALKWQWV